MEDLIKWKNSKNRKPLLLSGARQVGKTWIMKEFGKNEYDNCVYINFDREKKLHELLEQTIEPKKIISALSLILNCKISKKNTLIIFDEIQEEPRALSSLKYFCEDEPDYNIIAAGSFMGIALREGTSFPVGKVNSLTLYPLTFEEFLCADGKEGLSDLLKEGDIKSITSMKSLFIEELKKYYVVGGMPEIVQEYIDNGDFSNCREKQKSLLDFYKQDFTKHAQPSLVSRLFQVWDSIPSQLSKENRKFIYGNIEKGARAKNFELAIQWLYDCGLIHKVNRIKKPGMPLKFYEELNVFKLFLLDVGLLGAMSDLSTESIIEGNRVFTEFKGALTEQFVLQQLISSMKIKPYYYSEENSRGEIDFVIQKESEIIPIEVKAEENLKAKSLRAFAEKYKVKRSIRVSMSDYREQEWMVNYPLYAFSDLV